MVGQLNQPALKPPTGKDKSKSKFSTARFVYAPFYSDNLWQPWRATSSRLLLQRVKGFDPIQSRYEGVKEPTWLSD